MQPAIVRTLFVSHDNLSPDLLRPHGLTARAAAEQADEADLLPNVLLACIFSKLRTPRCCLDKCHQFCKKPTAVFPRHESTC